MVQLIYKIKCNFFDEFSCGYRIFAAEIAGDNFEAGFIFYFSEFFVLGESEV
jgi:hypothetical protein